MKKSKLLAAAPLAVAVLIAGCGGSSSSSDSSGSGGSSGSSSGYGYAPPAASTSASKTAAASTPTTATVTIAHSKFGDILVDSHGRTLYLFEADKSSSSTCYGACASLWPPLTVTGTPKAGPNVKASLLGTTKRTDGTTEVTYAGHPLYYYAPDTAAGDFTGQGLNQFGAAWYVVSSNGTAVTSG
jgi:predicted lipoprotein with Yx(FWY)xxD motif